MELGAHLPLLSFAQERRGLSELRSYAAAARDLGYAYLCANDHLVFSRPWLDGLTALAAVLENSGSMRLATTVALPVVRGPAALAKAAAALDALSEGRLVLGVGPGSSARDYQLAGIPFEERWARLDDAVQTLRAFFSGDDAYQGRFYSTKDFQLAPHPVQIDGPPIWVGSWGSTAGLRRVARLADGWIASGYNTTPSLFASARAALDDQLQDDGRRIQTTDAAFPNALATIWTYVTESEADAERTLREVLAPMLNRPVDVLREQVPVGSVESCARKFAAFVQAGAQRFFVWPLRDEIQQLHLVAERVAPLATRLAAGAS